MTGSTGGRAVTSADPHTFGGRLADAVAVYGPLCVGNDPHSQLLDAWGLSRDVAGLERCARTMVEAAAGRVAIMKPQSAFFEAYGSAGIAVLERVLADARQAGVLMLLDAKRGDIGSTMDAYARAYLADESPLRADALTLSPYLGVRALAPAFELAAGTGRGVFVLARTSNPDGEAVQRATVRLPRGGGISVAQRIADEVDGYNPTGDELGSFGLVVGATPGSAAGLDLRSFHGPVLAPGYGAQGGTADTIRVLAERLPGIVLPSSSRDIMAAGPDPAGIGARIDAVQRELAGR